MGLVFPLSRPALLLAFLAVVAGCASAPPLTRAEPAEVSASIASAAAQVRRCYRTPQVASEGRQIVTRLLARYTIDGSLAGLPVVVAQEGLTPANQQYAGRMAEAAIGAVVRCVPIRLPQALHPGGWESLEFTFSPRRRA